MTVERNYGWLQDEDGNELISEKNQEQQNAIEYVLGEIQNFAENDLEKVESGEELAETPEDSLETDNIEVNVSSDSIRPFHIVPTPRRIALSQLFARKTGLKIGTQFETNNWGFPPIPIPQYNPANKRDRFAPSNIEKEYLGHPIYWIDMKLTNLREGESRDMWSIRMFYLILAFGYWDDPAGSADWIDYPQSKGFIANSDDIELYHQIGTPPCRFDELPFLKEDDLLVPYEELEAIYSSTISSISESMKFETLRYSELQIEALVMAKELLGWDRNEDLPYDLPIRLDRETNVWNKTLKIKLQNALADYTGIKTDFNSNSTEDVDRVAKELNLVTDEITVVLLAIDYIIATLSIPSANSNLDYYSYANWISLLNLTFHENENRSKYYNFSSMIDELVNGRASASYYISRTLDEITENGENDPAKQAYLVINDLFSNSIDRLRLEIFNYKRIYMNLSRIDSIQQMESIERQHLVNQSDVHSPVDPIKGDQW